jgi:WhiB family redox-sensing transcriptional regulator
MSASPGPDDHPSPLAPSGWTEWTACRGEDPDLFYPPEGERGGHLAPRELVAKRICATCPVADGLCAGRRRTLRVWGGLTAAERERRRRRRV